MSVWSIIQVLRAPNARSFCLADNRYIHCLNTYLVLTHEISDDLIISFPNLSVLDISKWDTTSLLSLSLSPPTSTQVASNLNTIWTNSICQSLSNHDGMNVAGWVDQWMIHPLDCWGLIKRLAGWLLIGPVVKFWCTGPWWRYKNITDGIRLIEIIRVTLR